MKKMICFAGLDGSGKTTQCKMLYNHFSQYNPIYFPFLNTQNDKYVNRATINYIKNSKKSFTSEQKYLIRSAQAMYLDIVELTQSGQYDNRIVILDRYIETIYAHAKYYGISFDIISEIYREIVVYPDCYLFLHLAPELCYHRLLQRGEALEAHEDIDNLTRLNEIYMEVVELLNITIVDANQSPDDVHRSIIQHIK